MLCIRTLQDSVGGTSSDSRANLVVLYAFEGKCAISNVKYVSLELNGNLSYSLIFIFYICALFAVREILTGIFLQI